jgi:hypothetical protein
MWFCSSEVAFSPFLALYLVLALSVFPPLSPYDEDLPLCLPSGSFSSLTFLFLSAFFLCGRKLGRKFVSAKHAESLSLHTTIRSLITLIFLPCGFCSSDMAYW